jgi:hypothetical protein
MPNPLTLLVLAALLAAAAAPAVAQTTLSDIQKKIDSTASDLAQVDAMLADPDANRRLAAIQMLLASGNAAWADRARQVGLFSPDPELQRAVIASIFDAGTPLRVDFDLSQADEKTTLIRRWLYDSHGSVDEAAKVGQITIRLEKFDPEKKCWKFAGDRDCAFMPTGSRYTFNTWRYMTGSVALSSDGALTGVATVTYNAGLGGVPVRIPLSE